MSPEVETAYRRYVGAYYAEHRAARHRRHLNDVLVRLSPEEFRQYEEARERFDREKQTQK